MPAKPINTEYKIPGQQGDLNAYQPAADDPRFAEQTSARLQLQQVYRSEVNTSYRVSSAPTEPVRGGSADQPTFAQVEPFLHEVGDWMAFNRSEVAGNGWVS